MKTNETNENFVESQAITEIFRIHWAWRWKQQLTNQSPLRVHLLVCSGAFDCITWSSAADQVCSVVMKLFMFKLYSILTLLGPLLHVCLKVDADDAVDSVETKAPEQVSKWTLSFILDPGNSSLQHWTFCPYRIMESLKPVSKLHLPTKTVRWSRKLWNKQVSGPRVSMKLQKLQESR